MKSLNLKAYAKLNLSLNILPKIKNGYHQVKLFNCELDLADEVKIKKADKNGIRIKCQWQENDCYDVSCPENCLAYQAAKLLQKKFPKKIESVEILIDKKIPARVGLGGGSADGAAVLRGLNKLYNLKLSNKRLLQLAAKIGSDVCYGVVGGLALVEGRGEKVTPLNVNRSRSYIYRGRDKRKNLEIFRKVNLVIIAPKIKKPSTAWACKNLDHKKIGKNLDKFGKLISAIVGQASTSDRMKLAGIGACPAGYFHNDFEFSIFKQFPEVKKIKEELLAFGAKNAMLAGSGLAVAGFFEKKEQAKKALKFFKKDGKDIYLTKIR